MTEKHKNFTIDIGFRKGYDMMRKTVFWVVLNCVLVTMIVLLGWKTVDILKERRLSEFIEDRQTTLVKQGKCKVQTGNIDSTYVLMAIPTDDKGQVAKEVESQLMSYLQAKLGSKKPTGKIKNLLIVSTVDAKTDFKNIQSKEIQAEKYQVDTFSIQEKEKETTNRILLTTDFRPFTLIDLLPNIAGAKNILISKIREQLESNQSNPVSVEQVIEQCKHIDMEKLAFSYSNSQITVAFPDDRYGVKSVTIPMVDFYPVVNSDYLSDADKANYDTYVAEKLIDKKSLRQIALTFDDGPNPNTTPRVLELLKQYGAKGTFFVVGKAVAGNEDLLKQIVAEGHEVANHTWNHPNLTTISADKVRREIQDTQAAIKAVLGKEPTMIRPPYGAVNQSVVDVMGLPSIYWSVDSEDWLSRDKNAIFERIKAQTQPGSIILMHDIHQPTVDALEMVLQFLTSEGYHMVTTTDLLGENLDPCQ